MEKAKFKVEMEIEVEYDKVEGIETTPYTRISGTVLPSGRLIIFTDEGRIVDFQHKIFERKE